MMLRAVVLACLGAWVISLLKDPAIAGARLFALVVLAGLLIMFSVIDAFASIYNAATRYMDAAAQHKLDEPQDPPADKIGHVRYMLQTDAQSWVFATLPNISPEKLIALADGMLRGVPFSERAWRGEISNFRFIQDEFNKRGLARLKRKTPQQGYKLTREGWNTMRDIKNGSAPRQVSPSPT